MDARCETDAGVLRISIRDEALLGATDWGAVRLPAGDDAPVLVVIDLARAYFVAGRFLAGCVQLADALAQRDAELVLLNLRPSAARVLQTLDGGKRVTLAGCEAEVEARRLALTAQCANAPGQRGVGIAEKRALWS